MHEVSGISYSEITALVTTILAWTIARPFPWTITGDGDWS
jgi:hypothetical protein